MTQLPAAAGEYRLGDAFHHGPSAGPLEVAYALYGETGMERVRYARNRECTSPLFVTFGA